MKKAFVSAFLCVIAVLASAQNYPDIYLRGQLSGWEPKDEYKFNREGDVYSIHLDALDAEFKIGDALWNEVDFGGETKAVIGRNTSIQTKFRGANMIAENYTDITLSFIYSPENSSPRLFIDIEPTDNIPVEGLSGTLPVLYINVYTDDTKTQLDNSVISKDLDHKDYFKNSEYWLEINDCEWAKELGAKDLGSREEPLPMQIKARGNWTRIGYSKKPFKLKLDSKVSMLGMSKSKHYAILAHADDNFGYLRNFTGFELGKLIGLPWTPSQQPVEVVINNNYRGLYFLTESIRIEKDRINIAELDDNISDPELISGGYLVELDNYDEDNQIQMEEKSFVGGYRDKLRITFDTPEEYSDLQRRFVTDQFTAINDAVGANSDDLWRYLDLDDAVRYYIVEELISHVESYHGSTYLFRDRGADRKWHFSPIWDCGNAFNGPTDDFFYNHAPYGCTWIASIRCNETFNAKLKETWLWFMSNHFSKLFQAIDGYVGRIYDAAVADRARWKDQAVPAGGQPVVDNSDMEAQRRKVIFHLADKATWLSKQFGNYTLATYPEPARDTTPAAALPDYVQTGIEDIAADTDSDTPAVYYNLQGIRVANPGPGIYIERRGNSSRTVRL